MNKRALLFTLPHTFSSTKATREISVEVLFYPEWNYLIFFTVQGLHDREGRGHWEWVGGEPVNYTNWRKMPLQSKKQESKKCVLVWRRAKWQIRDCKTSRVQRFVCSVKIWIQHCIRSNNNELVLKKNCKEGVDKFPITIIEKLLKLLLLL